MKKKWIVLLAVFVVIILLSACSGGAEKQGAEGKQASNISDEDMSKPVTLEVMLTGSKEAFEQKLVNAKIKEKFPNITFDYTAIKDWDKVIASGGMPDLVNLTPTNYYLIGDNGLSYDHTSLMKKYNFDMTKFIPEYLELAKQLGGGKGLFAVPDKMDFPYGGYALVYNKDIFDKFAIPYPKSGMTWDEAIELAKRFNRVDNGVQYRGLTMTASWVMLRMQQGLDFVNKSGKVDLSNKGWMNMLGIAKDATAAQDGWAGAAIGNLDFFAKDKDTAMLAGVVNALLVQAETYESTLNWDMAALPHFAGQPATQPGAFGYFAITSKSQHKDAAIQVLKALLEDNADRKSFENPAVLKKNINAIKNQKITLGVPSRYDNLLTPILQKKVQEVVTQNKDANTAIRELQDEMQKIVDQQQHGGN